MRLRRVHEVRIETLGTIGLESYDEKIIHSTIYQGYSNQSTGYATTWEERFKLGQSVRDENACVSQHNSLFQLFFVVWSVRQSLPSRRSLNTSNCHWDWQRLGFQK